MPQLCLSTFDFEKQTLELREILVSRDYVFFLVLTLPERDVCMAVFSMSCILQLLAKKAYEIYFCMDN